MSLGRLDWARLDRLDWALLDCRLARDPWAWLCASGALREDGAWRRYNVMMPPPQGVTGRCSGGGALPLDRAEVTVSAGNTQVLTRKSMENH